MSSGVSASPAASSAAADDAAANAAGAGAIGVGSCSDAVFDTGAGTGDRSGCRVGGGASPTAMMRIARIMAAGPAIASRSGDEGMRAAVWACASRSGEEGVLEYRHRIVGDAQGHASPRTSRRRRIGIDHRGTGGSIHVGLTRHARSRHTGIVRDRGLLGRVLLGLRRLRRAIARDSSLSDAMSGGGGERAAGESAADAGALAAASGVDAATGSEDAEAAGGSAEAGVAASFVAATDSDAGSAAVVVAGTGAAVGAEVPSSLCAESLAVASGSLLIQTSSGTAQLVSGRVLDAKPMRSVRQVQQPSSRGGKLRSHHHA